MKYTEVEDVLRNNVAAATPESSAATAAYAVTLLTSMPELDDAVAAEFTPDAADAFTAACRAPADADEQSLTDWLVRIDAGDLTDGDMDTYTLWALTALEAWRDFQRAGAPDSVYTLVLTTLEVVDFEIDGADLDDFLSDPRMSTQFSTIMSLLAGQAA